MVRIAEPEPRWFIHGSAIHNMKIYWTLRSVPELQKLSKNERKEVWRHSSKKALLDAETLFAFVVCCGCIWLGGHFGEQIGGGEAEAIIGVLAGGFIYGQVAVYATRRHIRTRGSS